MTHRTADKHSFATRALSALLVAGLTAFIGVPSIPPSPVNRIESELIPGSQPEVCTALRPAAVTNQSVSSPAWGMEYGDCPAGYAAFAVRDPGGKKRAAEKIPAVLTCCPLPTPDILSDEHVLVAESCPEGYVVTGTRVNLSCEQDCRQLMRCTKISRRFQLSEPHASKYWGNGFAGWQGSERIERQDIPLSLRSAIGRVAEDYWERDGCVGYPWGSLLTKKASKYCGGFFFRELQFSGRPGDPPSGTRVRMLP